MIKADTKKLEKEAQIILNHYKAGNFSTAEIKAKKLLKKSPGYVSIYNVLGLTLTEQKKTQEAIKCYQDAISIKPNFALAYNNLGNIYDSIGKKDEAENCFMKSVKIQPNSPIAHNNLGNFLRNNRNKYGEAISCYKKALEYDSNIFVIHNNLGVTYQYLGKFDEATNCFRKALKINPSFAAAHRQIAMNTKYNENSDHLKEMKNIFSNKNISNGEKIHLSFGLGKAYEDIKDYKKAFENYKIGNDCKRKSYKYSIDKEVNLFTKIKNAFNENSLNQFKNQSNASNVPIFIVGMPRSGTTLIEQIISSHPHVYGAGELKELNILVLNYFSKTLSQNDINFPKNLSNFNKLVINEIGNKYFESLIKYSNNHKFISDKAPLNFRWIGLIKLILPNAKIIHCVRDSKDTCLSIFKNFFAGTVRFAYDLEELGAYYNLYSDLMKHWHKVLPNYIYDVSYEKLVENQKEETRKILDFCNLEWNDLCIQFHKSNRPVQTASLAQIRDPIYKNSVKSWKRYEKELNPLLKILNNQD